MIPSGTIVFLFTDVEGSSRLWERFPDAMKQVMARHDQILRAAIEQHGGYIVKMTGDGVHAAFAMAAAAVGAALSSQRTLATEPWGDVGMLRVRMGLHTGAADLRDGDYFGSAVNRAARLMAVGHGGQILLSAATEALLRDALAGELADPYEREFYLRDLGQHRLKDLGQPEHIFQLVSPQLPSDFPPLRTLTTRLNNLPLQPTPFVGREQAVQSVCALLMQPEVRLLTLTGPGGTGKTRLSLHVAGELLEQFEDGIFLVPLSTMIDPEQLVAAIARTLDLQERGGHLLAATLKDYLHDKHLLLVLDNFEQVIAAGPQVADLLAASSRLKILVSSREALHLYGEKEYAVPPLKLPDLQHLPPPEQLTMYEAVRLFVERAQDIKPDFSLNNQNAPAVAEICYRLDGLPLAIELAAARVRVLPPQAILGRLAKRLNLLTGGASNLPMRQQTLRGAIDWSHDLLDAGEKVLFRQLAIFVGGCTLEAVEAVCNVQGELDLDVLDGLDSLISKSLLQQQETAAGEPRFGMLETIHEYALERLEASGEGASSRQRHTAFFLALAETAEPALKDARQSEWLKRLETEHHNLRAALRRSSEEGDSETTLRMAGALAWFWRLQGHLSEGRTWLDRALGLPGAAEPSQARAHALSGAGTLAMLQGDLKAAQQQLEESITLLQGWNDRSALGFALRTLGMVRLFRGDLAEARTFLEESLRRYRAAGDPWGIAMANMMLGLVALRGGDLSGAQTYNEVGLSLLRKVGDPWFLAVSLNNLGDVARLQGDYGRAAGYYEESLGRFRAGGNRRDVAASLQNLGYVAHYQHDDAQAVERFKESLRWHHEAGNKEGMTECLIAFARVASASGQAERAARLLGGAHALREAMGALAWPAGQAEYESNVAAVRAQLETAVFERCWIEGQALSLEQAVSYVLEELPT